MARLARYSVTMSSPRIHALTVDVEDYFQVTALDAHLSRDAWATIPSRVAQSTATVLEVLARTGTRGTFFILGWVAQQYPQVVRDIDAAGHEIASHSFWHHQIYRQSADDFRADVRRSRQVLEDLTGRRVQFYRAPTFSITNRSLWALDILAEEGFTLDASIFPIRHDRYGIPDAPRELHQRSTKSGPIWEFPPTVARWGNANLPVGGGGYFRLLPYAWTRMLWRRAEQQLAQPLMFYFHPWELDPEQPRMPGMSRMSAWRHRVNLHSMQQKLERLLRDFRFGAIGDVLTASTAQHPVAAEVAA